MRNTRTRKSNIVARTRAAKGACVKTHVRAGTIRSFDKDPIEMQKNDTSI